MTRFPVWLSSPDSLMDGTRDHKAASAAFFHGWTTLAYNRAMPDIHTQTLAVVPDLLALHAARRDLFPGLLQSAGPEGWDILFALPDQSRVYLHHEAADFVRDLAALPRSEELACDLPFSGGWLVYAGYELLEVFEPTVPSRDEEAFPVAALIRCPAAVQVNRATGVARLVAETAQETGCARGCGFGRALAGVAACTGRHQRRRAAGFSRRCCGLQALHLRRRCIPGQPVARLGCRIAAGAGRRRVCATA